MSDIGFEQVVDQGEEILGQGKNMLSNAWDWAQENVDPTLIGGVLGAVSGFIFGQGMIGAAIGAGIGGLLAHHFFKASDPAAAAAAERVAAVQAETGVEISGQQNSPANPSSVANGPN